KRNGQGLDAGLFPPRGLVTMPMDLAVMQPANRDRELVADLAPKRTGLGKAQVMWVGRRAATYEARLGRDEPAVLFVAQADGLCGDAAATDVEFARDRGRLSAGL